MRALFLSEGGRAYGYGHITRSYALANFLRSKHVTVEFGVAGDNTVEGLLADMSYSLGDWCGDRSFLNKVLQASDIAVVDSYRVTPDICACIADAVATPVFFDDNNRCDYPRGLVVNGNMYAPQIVYPQIKEVRYLLGAAYMPLREPFWQVPEKLIRTTIDTVLIALGGTDTSAISKVIMAVVQERLPFVKRIMVVDTAIARAVTHKMTVITYADAIQMKSLMLEADLAITGGGQTLNELARIGMPTIAIALAPNQERNVQAWQALGFSDGITTEQLGTIESTLNEHIKNNQDQSVREQKKTIGRQTIDGRGIERIVHEVLSYGT